MDQLDTLRWQFDLTLRLADHHLPALTDRACLWTPTPNAWSVRRGEDGNWRPDWSEPAPEPAPAVTIGWLSWHLLWWSGGFVAALRGDAAPAREACFWPGSADGVRTAFARIRRDWSAILNGLADADLARPFAYPWREPRPLRYGLAWANAELMKNVAEIGAVRHLCEAADGDL